MRNCGGEKQDSEQQTPPQPAHLLREDTAPRPCPTSPNAGPTCCQTTLAPPAATPHHHPGGWAACTTGVLTASCAALTAELPVRNEGPARPPAPRTHTRGSALEARVLKRFLSVTGQERTPGTSAQTTPPGRALHNAPWPVPPRLALLSLATAISNLGAFFDAVFPSNIATPPKSRGPCACTHHSQRRREQEFAAKQAEVNVRKWRPLRDTGEPVLLRPGLPMAGR